MSYSNNIKWSKKQDETVFEAAVSVERSYGFPPKVNTWTFSLTTLDATQKMPSSDVLHQRMAGTTTMTPADEQNEVTVRLMKHLATKLFPDFVAALEDSDNPAHPEWINKHYRSYYRGEVRKEALLFGGPTTVYTPNLDLRFYFTQLCLKKLATNPEFILRKAHFTQAQNLFNDEQASMLAQSQAVIDSAFALYLQAFNTIGLQGINLQYRRYYGDIMGNSEIDSYLYQDKLLLPALYRIEQQFNEICSALPKLDEEVKRYFRAKLRDTEKLMCEQALQVIFPVLKVDQLTQVEKEEVTGIFCTAFDAIEAVLRNSKRYTQTNLENNPPYRELIRPLYMLREKHTGKASDNQKMLVMLKLKSFYTSIQSDIKRSESSFEWPRFNTTHWFMKTLMKDCATVTESCDGAMQRFMAEKTTNETTPGASMLTAGGYKL